MKKALQIDYLRAQAMVSETAAGARPGEARRGGSRDEPTELVVGEVGRERGGLLDVLGAGLDTLRPPRGLDVRRRRQRPRREADRGGSGSPDPVAQGGEHLRAEHRQLVRPDRV